MFRGDIIFQPVESWEFLCTTSKYCMVVVVNPIHISLHEDKSITCLMTKTAVSSKPGLCSQKGGQFDFKIGFVDIGLSGTIEG